MIRHAVVILLDLFVAASSIVVALLLRVGDQMSAEMSSGIVTSTPVFAAIAFAVFYGTGLHRPVWRYTSLADWMLVVRSASIAVAVFVVVSVALGQFAWMPRSLPAIQWLVLVVALGATRTARRLAFESRRGTEQGSAADAPVAVRSKRALIAGPSDQVETLLRLIETNPDTGLCPVGLLNNDGGQLNLRVRGVPILGSIDDLDHVVRRLQAQGRTPDRLIIGDTQERLLSPRMVRLVNLAESLGLKVACLPKLVEVNDAQTKALDLRFINVAELLGRPQTPIDTEAVAQAITGSRVLVTGAGGTIGRELVRQIAAQGPAELILLDASEFNLYDVDLEIGDQFPELSRTAVLCSIRQRHQVMQVFADHRPEIVFHAAALKHVPLVEQNPCAGIQTNVLGTRNVADAAKRYRARAMVQVSTDKAVNPVGVMGATKRLGELYCQALDIEGRNDPHSPRFMTVRFGNVLGSSGSLIPLFQRQLSRGLPLTVTHEDIERYFMTVNEAVHLVLKSMAYGLSSNAMRGRIFVLDMGQPIKIMEIARRMIRLAGLVPGEDVQIEIVGLRPGEKLFEEVFGANERQLPSPLPGIFVAEPDAVPLARLAEAFDRLVLASAQGNTRLSTQIVRSLLNDEHANLTPASPIIRFKSANEPELKMAIGA